MLRELEPARQCKLRTLSCAWVYSALFVICCHFVINCRASVPSNDRLVRGTTPTSFFTTKDEFNVEDILSSPDASRILKDSTSSAPKQSHPLDQVVGAWPAQNRIESESEFGTVRPTVETSSSGSSSTVPNKISRNLMSSPLHVARCRANCVEKFRPNVGSVTRGKDSSEAPRDGTGPLEDLHLSITWTCVGSETCLLCWKSCELLEPEDLTFPLPSSLVEERSSSRVNGGAISVRKHVKGSLPGKSEEMSVGSPATATKKQSILPCAMSKHCVAGCQVACSFYQTLQPGESNKGTFSSAPDGATTHPVVAMKHETVLSLAQGKVTWPASQASETSGVVYIVILEYPDRKWRQVVQTTRTEIDIPFELTATESAAKLSSVRVLVVGTNGLVSIYNPVKSLPDQGRSAKSDRVNNRTSSEGRFANENTPDVIARSDAFTAGANDHQMGYANTFVTSSPDTPSLGGERTRIKLLNREDPFNLRLVSLIHQKSLVIAELVWNGDRPEQDYLITWELHGGGLKGHLVTDSTSVTLSLWPDTTYQIQVETFEKKLDSEVYASSTSGKSLGLTVDTSTASFPLQPPSALRSGDSDETSEDSESYENEDLSQDENKLSFEDLSHKSITPGGGFLNMTLFLGIAIAALLFVLVILAVAGFTWTKMRAVDEQLRNNNNGHHHRRPGSPSLEWCSTSPIIFPEKYRHGCGDGDNTGSYCDCDGGDNSPGTGCYSYSNEPQSLLYSQEDYSWDECPYYYQGEALERPSFYSGSSSGDDYEGRLDMPYSFYRRKETEPCVSVISSGSNDLQMPSLAPSTTSRYPPALSSSYLTSFYRGSSSIGYALLGEPRSSGEACYYP